MVGACRVMGEQDGAWVEYCESVQGGRFDKVMSVLPVLLLLLAVLRGAAAAGQPGQKCLIGLMHIACS